MYRPCDTLPWIASGLLVALVGCVSGCGDRVLVARELNLAYEDPDAADAPDAGTSTSTGNTRKKQAERAAEAHERATRNARDDDTGKGR